MEPLTLQFSQGSSKCLETFHILKDFSADAKRGKFEKSTALTFLNANNGYRVCWVVTQESWNLLKDDQRKRCTSFMKGIRAVFKEQNFMQSSNCLRGWPRSLQIEFFGKSDKLLHAVEQYYELPFGKARVKSSTLSADVEKKFQEFIADFKLYESLGISGKYKYGDDHQSKYHCC